MATSNGNSSTASTYSSTSSGFGDALGTGIVEIYVRSSKKHYRVHKSIISTKFDGTKLNYFAKMFNNGSRETAEQKAEFPELELNTFDLFLEWIYRDSFHPRSYLSRQACVDSLTARTKLYGFADQLRLLDLMDYTLITILSTLKETNLGLGMKGTECIYEHTPPGSKFRDFAARNLHFRLAQGSVGEDYMTVKITASMMKYQDLTHDLLELMGGSPKEANNPLLLPICTFHVHAKDEECKHTMD